MELRVAGTHRLLPLLNQAHSGIVVMYAVKRERPMVCQNLRNDSIMKLLFPVVHMAYLETKHPKSINV